MRALFTLIFLFALPLSGSGATVRSAVSGRWSAGETWEGGRVPTASDVVQILAGHEVMYDAASDAVLRMVQVGGVLRFARDKDTLLCAGLIKVQPGDDLSEEGFDCHGPTKPAPGQPQPVLEIGSANEPIPAAHRAIIRLTYVEGMNLESCPALVCCGGRMELHGAPLSRSWVKLGVDATRGSSEIVFHEPVSGWRVGDHVLLPTTEMSEFYQEKDGRRVIGTLADDTETEVGEIAAISEQGLVLKEPLKFKHQAQDKFRGEIADLTRNVVIESADPQEARGHTMFHRNSAGSISYVEFRHLGKKGVLGRYPIHFHLCGDTMRGTSIVGVSIWDSQNRWLTIHGTNDLVVRDCVGYQSIGHGFFFEDGTEVDNVLDGNLAVQALTGEPLRQQNLPFDPNDGSGFWWANCRNSFTRNVAVECGKHGYHFQMQQSAAFNPELPVRQPDGTIRRVDVRTLPFIRFEANEAHSQRRFGFNLGGFHAQTTSEDLDRDGNVIDRVAYLSGDVQGVGPDFHHPFRIKDYLVWRSQWGFHSGAPNVQLDGFTANDVNYAEWRTNIAGHDYNRVQLTNIHVSSFLNNWGENASRANQLRYLDPVDDAPPLTVITGWQWQGPERVKVTGIAVDNETVQSVTVDGKSATLKPGLVTEWAQELDAPGGQVEVIAGAVDAKENRELTPHRLRLSHETPDWGTLLESPAQKNATQFPKTSMAMTRTDRAGIAVSEPLPARPSGESLAPWPQWDGQETVAQYAQRVGLAPAKTIDLGGEKLELVLIPSGSFLMGAAPGEEGAAADEQPRHWVALPPFYLGKCEVTQAQYEKVMGNNPSHFRGRDLPVEQVSWEDARQFTAKAAPGLRLPTEAEWEFACRAGTTTPFASGADEAALDRLGWYGGGAGSGYHSVSSTTAVGRKDANAFGLQDMHGNVYEWCADWYDPHYYAHSPVLNPTGPSTGLDRVLRGGSWETAATLCRSANRNGFSPRSHGYVLGFRVALPISEPPPHTTKP